MLITHDRNWFFNWVVRPIRRKFDFTSFLTFLVGLGGLGFTIFQGIRFHAKPAPIATASSGKTVDSALLQELTFRVDMPWHFSASLIGLVILLGFYISRYHRVRTTRWAPKSGYSAIHSFAEELRELSSADYIAYARRATKGELTEVQLKKLIFSHLNFSKKLCEHARSVMHANSVKMDRVCIKLAINRKLVKIASTAHPNLEVGLVDGELCEKSCFWRLLNRVHFEYKRWGCADPICNHPVNRELRERPRFLAISGIEKVSPSRSWNTLVDNLYGNSSPQKSDVPQPRFETASQLWSEFRTKVNQTYTCCFGLAIAGKALADPLEEGAANGSMEVTNKVIGFIGLDAKSARALDYLEQDDLEGLAALSDASFAVLQNLVAFYEALANQS